MTGESEISTYDWNYLKISTHKTLQTLSWLRVGALQAPQVSREDSIIKEWMFPATPKTDFPKMIPGNHVGDSTERQ